MVSFWEQLRILLWKNWTLRRRNKKRLIIEILWPLFLFLILMWVRTRGLKFKTSSCHLIEKALPSVGGFEFFQNFICTLNNTCHDDYVENTDSARWEDATIVRFIKETTPLINDILNNTNGRETVGKLWKDGMEYVKILSKLQDADNLRKLGKVRLRDFMNNEGLEKFSESVGTYTGLSKQEAEQFLEITVHLDKFRQENIDILLGDFQNEKCNTSQTYEMVTFPSREAFERFCGLSRDKVYMLLFVFGNYMDRPGLLRRLSATVAAEEKANEIIGTAPLRALEYDFDTFRKLGELGRKFVEVGQVFEQSSNLTGAEMASIFIYEGICGIKQDGNKSLFGVDPGAPNRYDSLRDRLKDWNPDHRYENDPEISPACNAVFQRLESMPISSFMWRQIKPIVRGYIYYAPETEITRMIMEKVETEFMKLQDVETAINTGLHLMHLVRLWMYENVQDLGNLKAFLGNRTNVEYIFRFLGVPTSSVEVERVYQVADSLDNVNIEEALERLDFASELLSEIIGCVRYNKTKGFSSEWKAVDEGHRLLSAEKLWAVVIFSNIDGEGEDGNQNVTNNATIPAHIYYKIRMDSDKVDGTRSVRDRLTSKGPRRRPLFDIKYITYGFVYLQEMIERGIIELVTGRDLSEEQVFLQQYPYPCYIVDQFIRAISRTFPLFMVLSWVYASAMIIKSVVLEKERRLREVMKIMGVSNAAVWTSWFIESFIIMCISSSILTVILKYGKVIEFSDPLLILLFLVSYTVATICFSFLVSTFFSRANSAAAAGGVMFFISYLPYNMMLIWEEQLGWLETLLGCLVSNVAFGFGCTYFARYEEDGIGAQWNNLTWQSLPDDQFGLIYCILMLWVDSLLYLVLTWYIEAVFPGEFGVPRPWNFCFKASYWSKAKSSKFSKKPNSHITENGASVRMFEESDYEKEDVEAEPQGIYPGVEVVKLSKTYSNGKVALDNLSINFYENQITSFLGHNGAGKTTTISILTGLFPPTKGAAIINGMDIRKDMDKIRTNLGICPQYNVLFDRLNVYEHLKFYALLKGKKGEEVEKEFDEMLSDLGIPHKRAAYPDSLSGGMKRKLSVAIAFVGGSKTVFLDEPTSGVDPFSRRSIWELLLKYKHGRTVILTTHFMDEADILGDRIAIISQGKLKALGSSLFLKSHFGQGYTLHLVKNDEFTVEAEVPENKSKKNRPMSHESVIEKFVQDIIPDAVMTDNVGSEIAFLLPYDEIEKFSVLFEKLQENLSPLGILNYGISDTSLEDVFLKITVDDLRENVESFNALSSTSKRKFMCLLTRCREQFSQSKNAVTHMGSTTPPKNPSDSTNSTALSHHTIGDFCVNINDLKTEENGAIHSGSTVKTMFERKRQEDGDMVSSASDVEAVTTSLLEQAASGAYTPSIETESRKVRPRRWPVHCCLCFIQIFMIVRKRIWNSKRNKKAMFFEIILPAVFIAITLAFTLILPPATDEPAREITPWTYPSPNNIFFSEPNRTRRKGIPSEFRNVLNELIGPIGMGTACLVDQNRNICHESKWNNDTVQLFNTTRMNFHGTKFSSCSCEIGSLQCPADVNKPRFPTLKTQTDDLILDVSNTNIPEWILKTYDKFMDSRYGGFEFQVRKPYTVNLGGYLGLLTNFTSLLGLTETEASPHYHEKSLTQVQEVSRGSLVSKSRRVYKVWYENRGWVSSVAYLNALHNMWLREKLPQEYQEQKNQFGITLIMHPMNLTKSQSNKESLKTAGLGLIHAICIIFALSFIPASFTVYLIDERKSGGKHLHLVSGVRPITYWIGNFLFDMLKYLVPTALCLLLFAIFDAQAYIGRASFWPFLCLLLLYGWASIPAMYPFSFIFGIPSTAFVVLACTNLFIGVVTTVSTSVLEQFGDEELEAVGNILKKAFLVFPHYCLGRGCIELVKLNLENTALAALSMSSSHEVDRFDWDHLGEKLFFLGIHGIVYFLLNLICEYRHIFLLILKLLPAKQRINVEEDIDVQKERERVENTNEDSLTLSAINLTKFYKRKKYPAVNGITFGMGGGECFGLLGVNGAGKSTTFKMLTGDARISSGKAKICGADVETSLDAARKHFGYCPQEDSIDPLLTGYELLILYGRLRGLSATDTEKAAHRLIKTLGLSRYAKRNSGTYSGGNKRKLSTAIALIGDPDVIFLDEPTSGMDPGARRDLWKVILDLLHKGRTVVLTSHSMEECEVLCTKIAIMVNGQFMCMGSLQHLKNRFGKGYTLTIRCMEATQNLFLESLSEGLPEATLEDQHCSQLKLNIPQEAAHLSKIFSTLSAYKAEGTIEDYSVSQTTLDDIFVKFAIKQKDALDR